MKAQVHNKFKFFSIESKDGKISAKAKKEILSFTNNEKITPKSVGVEFVESDSTLIISIGYSSRKDSNKYNLVTKKIGKFTGSNDIPAVEKSMEKVASKLDGIICHEFFTTNEKEMFSIFLLAN